MWIAVFEGIWDVNVPDKSKYPKDNSGPYIVKVTGKADELHRVLGPHGDNIKTADGGVIFMPATRGHVKEAVKKVEFENGADAEKFNEWMKGGN